jgi:tRNA-binding protein
MATLNDFAALDIRIGTVVAAVPLLKARKSAFQLQIDFGHLGTKSSSAQLTERYAPEWLVGRQVVAIINLPPMQVANFISQCLVLGIYSSEGGVVLLQPDGPVANGDKIG